MNSDVSHPLLILILVQSLPKIIFSNPILNVLVQIHLFKHISKLILIKIEVVVILNFFLYVG
jgi:ABC-type maltose transport system permease subunit